MPTTDVTAPGWTTVTLTVDEIWQAREATILATLENPVREDQGLELIPGAVYPFKAGDVVRYRPKMGGAVAPILVREAR